MNEPSLDHARLENVKQLEGGAIRAACPACRAAGSDKSGNHLLVKSDGKFGCAANPKDEQHRKEIFKLAGAQLKSSARQPKSKLGRIVATYDYMDEFRNPMFQVVRYEPKDFRQRKSDGNGGWKWKVEESDRVLFRLPEILADVAMGRPIYICEGEKDVLAMVKNGFSATCNPGGALKWQDSFSNSLSGAHVCIIADKDTRGRDHAQLVASKLQNIAASVRVIELPDTNGKPVKDAADFFAAGGQPADLDELEQAEQIPETDIANQNNPPGRFFTIDDLDSFDSTKDINNRIGNRYLCKGGKWLFAAPSGAGKSSLAVQSLMLFALGRDFFGIKPVRALSSLLVGDENDQGDLAEMFQGTRDFLNLNLFEHPDDFELLRKNLKFWHCPALSGFAFLTEIERELKKSPRDICCLDPLVSFAGVDLTKQDQAAQFLRSGLSRISEETGVIWFIIHHTPKPKERQDGKTRILSESQYAGAGSFDLPGWARAVMALEEVQDGVFRLILSKRKKRAGATHPSGEPTTIIWLKQAENGIHWEQIDPPAEPEPKERGKGGRPNIISKIMEFGLGGLIDSISTPLSKNQLAERIQTTISEKFGEVGMSTCKSIVDKLMENRAIKHDGNGYVKP